MRQPRSTQQGNSIVEVLVTISLLAISGLAVAQSTIRAFSSLNRSYRTSLAGQVALDRMEILAERDPSTLENSLDETNEAVVMSGATFYRSTSIVVNSDGSRTVTVSVRSPQNLSGKATLSTTLPLRGNL